MNHANARTCLTYFILGFALFLVCSPQLPPSKADQPSEIQVTTIPEQSREKAVLAFSKDEWDRVRHRQGRFVLRGVPVPGRGINDSPASTVDLELSPFSIFSPETQFVIGNNAGDDRPANLDPTRFTMLRGKIKGVDHSHAFLAIGPRSGTGRIEFGGSAKPYEIAMHAAPASPSEGPALVVFNAQESGDLLPDVPLCGVEHADSESTAPSTAGFGTGVGDPVPPEATQTIELAVETDYEYYELFNDAEAAFDHVVLTYAAVSDIFQRDVNSRVVLSFVRIWDTPDDPYEGAVSLPMLSGFWNNEMTGVHRDVVQFFSGRRNFSFGGIAYLFGLCNGSSYSIVGYIQGTLSSPGDPARGNYDIGVSAHELGHNCGTLHTHDYNPPIDQCFPLPGVPSRGTIMAYCGQTISGGNANRDLRLHARVQAQMRSYIFSAGCVADDCNGNGLDDAQDVAAGVSPDANGNTVPDECEDCNDNGVLDSVDIATGADSDVNSNGVPDDCESDCNGNGVPDTWDISTFASSDAYGNNIPDECEEDCDDNGVSDYIQIQAMLSRDINRDIRLDACEDCDGDGATDAEERAGAHNVWIASGELSYPGEFHAASGVLIRNADPGHVDDGGDLVYSPNGFILVASGGDDKVVAFDPQSAQYVGDFVDAGAGGLDRPIGLCYGPNGHLFVTGNASHNVLEFDGETGDFLNEFVPEHTAGLLGPRGLTFGPNGNLFVTSEDNQVYEFDGDDGAFIRIFVPNDANGGLFGATGLVFKPDGHLLVASTLSDSILEYDGDTGAFRGRWNNGGTPTALTLDRPWALRLGPTGNVFVTRSRATDLSAAPIAPAQPSRVQPLHVNTTRIYEFDARNGNFLRSFVMGTDAALSNPTGFDFVPGWNIDCNLSLLPDACDVASGASLDTNQDNVPDECQTDCNANGVHDRLDIFPLGASFDCNFNGVPDECDLASGVSGDCNNDGRLDICDNDCNQNAIPDGCETDCNANGVPDDCDITSDSSPDINNDGVPDECGPAGDFDDDGDLDLFDFVAFRDCVSGDVSWPGYATPDAPCLVFDFDSDADIDARDFGRVQAGFTGMCDGEIVDPPQNIQACVGDIAEFTVTATGSDLSYQWYRNGQPIQGATDATLSIFPVAVTGSYSVAVYNGCILAFSTQAVLTALPAPVIDTHPMNTTACPGDDVEFLVAASGGERFTYQWFVDGDPIIGATEDALSLTGVDSTDAGAYFCVVTNENGCERFSVPGVLTILNSIFVEQPLDADLCEGDDHFLVAIATGSPSYQWHKDGRPIDGANDFFYAIASAELDDAGVYHAVATGVCGELESASATVTVTPCPPVP